MFRAVFYAHHQELKFVHAASGICQTCLLLPLAVTANKFGGAAVEMTDTDPQSVMADALASTDPFSGAADELTDTGSCSGAADVLADTSD
jgi:hypothetical protein